jgi:hypothetical protein
MSERERELELCQHTRMLCVCYAYAMLEDMRMSERERERELELCQHTRMLCTACAR